MLLLAVTAGAVSIVSFVAVVIDQARELVERRELGSELELELCRVDALGLRHDEPSSRELDLELKRVIRLAQSIALGLRVGAQRTLSLERCLRRRNLRLELCEPRGDGRVDRAQRAVHSRAS